LELSPQFTTSFLTFVFGSGFISMNLRAIFTFLTYVIQKKIYSYPII
jgi:hypothetical protein